MVKRKLRRQLGLGQVIMLGTAGTIAAEIFVLTGHAAGMAGPAAVLALLLGGLLSYSVAINYCELATTYPETGGALTYVREAWGSNLLSYLVGSFDALSSTFYSALSAVGFAYSLQVFVPGAPVVPTALAVIAVFIALNILGVTKVGNAQIVLGGILLTALAIYVVVGLTRPGGFRWDTYAPGGSVFVYPGVWGNLSVMLASIALVYNAYVGFEVIADDAEEIREPARNIPRGILISLTVIIVIYVSVALVTLGTVPWQELAGSETALTDAARRFMPGLGVQMMALAGMIATLTSVNTAMLSATREAFTLGRDGDWPRWMARLSHFRTPHVAILVIGAIVALVAAVGLVDFLSYISSSGYLFVLFWASIAMIRLRRLHPQMPRPFKVPFFPLSAYAAAGSCLLIIAFTPGRALLFGGGVLLALTLAYYVVPWASRRVASGIRAMEPEKDRILVPVANPRSARRLVHLTAILAQASEDTSICVLTVVPLRTRLRQALANRLGGRGLDTRQQRVLQQAIAADAQARNVPLYTKLRATTDVARGVLDELGARDVKLIVMGWPGPTDSTALDGGPVKTVLQRAPTNVAVLLDRGLGAVRRILVPIGGGPHSRLALRMAYEIAEGEGAEVTALHCHCNGGGVEDLEDAMGQLREVVEDELGPIPARVATRVVRSCSVPDGIVAEAARRAAAGKPYDLLVVGASEEWFGRERLFGSVDDWVAVQVPCSVLLVRRYEPAPIAWIRRQAKRMDHEYPQGANGGGTRPMPVLPGAPAARGGQQ